ncbi:MAG: LptF/LptG family permease [Chitinivibrionales bacterium]
MILYRYIIKEHTLPFLYSLGIIIFIFTMQTAVQLLDKIISKGLAMSVVLEIFVIQLGWIIALAIPMSILTSALMTFGKMSSDNEIMAVKATGQSLTYLITPVFLAACIFAVLNIFFNDLILPDANHRAANLLSDISRKRPAVLIEPGILIRDFPDYALWVKKVNPKTGVLKTVRIFSDVPGEDPSTTVAESGEVKLTRDEKHMELTLYNGETHRVNSKNKKEYFVCRFKRQVIFLQNPDTELKRTNSEYRSDREMSSKMMLDQIAGYKKTRESYLIEHNAQVMKLISRIHALDSLSVHSGHATAPDTLWPDSIPSFAAWAAGFGPASFSALSEEKKKQSSLGRLLSRIRFQDVQISTYMVEVHKKFSLPIACIVFVLIGAPLGIMAKRGGIAVGASYSVFFFIVYWALLIGGEAMADKCVISPFAAMWSGNILIGACAVVLLLMMKRETKFFSIAPFIKFWNWLRRKKPGARPKAPGKIERTMRSLGNVPYFFVRMVAGTLPTYLIRKFIGWLAGFFLGITVIFVVVDYVSNLGRFENASLYEIALFYWYYLPWLIQLISPIVILLATMSSIGSMTRWNELTAMKTSGMNVRQLSAPLLLLGMVLAFLGFYMGEKVLPKANVLRRELTQNIGKDKTQQKGAVTEGQEYRRDFYYFGNEGTIYFFKELRTGQAQARGVWRETYEGNGISRKIIAEGAGYKNGSWKFTKGTIRSFDATSSTVLTFDTLLDTILKVSPKDMVVQIKSPEEMSYWELSNFADKTRRRGEDVSRYKAQLYFKIALPVMNFIVILLGISISARAGRKGEAVLFGIGLLLAFSYWIISQFSLAFAQNGQIPALLGAWVGNILFSIIAIFLYAKV